MHGQKCLLLPKCLDNMFVSQHTYKLCWLLTLQIQIQYIKRTCSWSSVCLHVNCSIDHITHNAATPWPGTFRHDVSNILIYWPPCIRQRDSCIARVVLTNTGSCNNKMVYQSWVDEVCCWENGLKTKPLWHTHEDYEVYQKQVPRAWTKITSHSMWDVVTCPCP